MDGYYADNIDSCKGDFNIDGDIDGYDLFKLMPSLEETGLSEFAGNFGNTDCLNEG